MDHLLIPPGATHIRVPYKCTEFYDGGDFFSYPERKKWTKEQLLGQDHFGGRKDVDVEAFFQSWLYFGTLISVFKLYGIEIDMSEFLTTDSQSGAVFVTTSEVLASKIRAWRTEWNRSKRDRDCAEAKTTRSVLNELAIYLDRYCGVEGREMEGAMHAPTTSTIAWPVADEIGLSMIALGHILGMALQDISGDGRVTLRWGASPMLKAKLLENGWCPLDVRRFLADVGIEGHYHLALKECAYEKGLHQGCDESACRALIVNEETYVVPHVQPGCTCECDMATEAVVEVIKNEGIPVVSWRKNVEGGGPRFIVEDGRSRRVKYVAISHVWADGLGNPKENSLPVCQLERIQSRVNAVFPKAKHPPIRFWMDTLCIPVADEYENLRKQSIKMMRNIYQRAAAVLVFDQGMHQLSSSSTPADKAVGLYMSNWMHRLWTFQEGMLAKELYFQLKDGVLDNDAFTKEGAKEEETDRERGLYRGFQGAVRSAAVVHFMVLKNGVVLNSVDTMALFPALAHAIQQRTTTRMSDEAICAATILDMDMSDIVAAKTKDMPDEVAAEKRMEIFLRQVGKFAPGIIFHAQKRLRTEGYRWAPKTIMGARPADLARDMDAKRSQFKGEGIRVFYPGFILESVGVGSALEITVMMKQDQHRYRLQIFPEDPGEDGGLPLWDPAAVYAVVMFRSISPHAMGTDAIVGKLKEPATVQEEQAKERPELTLGAIVRLNCECRAWVEPVDSTLPDVSMSPVLADLFGERQKWRVF